MRIAFVVHSLSTGGSERQCATLALALAAKGHHVRVYTLRGGGTLERELEAGRVPCTDLSRRRPWYRLGILSGLVRSLRRWQPDVVHSYLVVPNLLVAVLRPFIAPTRTVWGVRAAGEGTYRRFAGFAFNLSRLAARVPHLIIVNSEAGRMYHIRRGYPSHKLIVIENGIDTDRFQPDPSGRDRVRHEWGIAPGTRLVGLVARPDPRKDHETFLRAAGELVRSDEPVSFVCVGGASGRWFEGLDRLAQDLRLSDRLVWAQEREDMAAVYSALDVCCLSSLSEGFPNVVAEAMACGTPCVVTDVGDAAEIVGDTGVVVMPRDPRALAVGIRRLLALMNHDGGSPPASIRDRIVKRFSVDRLVEHTELALQDIYARNGAGFQGAP